MATGQVLFQRFYYSKSFIKHNMEVVAMSCVNLAAKIEEAPRRNRDVINVFHHLRQLRTNRVPSPLTLDQGYINTKNELIKSERRILKELGFCVHVKHPHKIIVVYLQVLECHKNQPLVQTAWAARLLSHRLLLPTPARCHMTPTSARDWLPETAGCPMRWLEGTAAGEAAAPPGSVALY
ncbi:cyclin-L1-like [Petromyzon marinus]|uniref:cyclin-L1-like n=1 Tax=Petromyzon marinus TaxID=7757 RepID=UPI003F6F5335